MEKKEGIIMKNIQERAKEWSEHIVETTPYDVVNGEVCVFAKDRDIADVAIESYIKGATDQKAIEEAVTITKYDAMTEKQLDREECFTSWYFQNAKGAPTFSDAIEWARKQTIDEAKSAFNKACGWLSTYTWYNEVVEEFIKAMDK